MNRGNIGVFLLAGLREYCRDFKNTIREQEITVQISKILSRKRGVLADFRIYCPGTEDYYPNYEFTCRGTEYWPDFENTVQETGSTGRISNLLAEKRRVLSKFRKYLPGNGEYWPILKITGRGTENTGQISKMLAEKRRLLAKLRKYYPGTGEYWPDFENTSRETEITGQIMKFYPKL